MSNPPDLWTVGNVRDRRAPSGAPSGAYKIGRVGQFSPSPVALTTNVSSNIYSPPEGVATRQNFHDRPAAGPITRGPDDTSPSTGHARSHESSGAAEWDTYEVEPGVQIRARRGTRVGVQQVGTDLAPAWVLTRGRRVAITGEDPVSGALTYAYAGVEGVLGTIAKAAMKAIQQGAKEEGGEADAAEEAGFLPLLFAAGKHIARKVKEGADEADADEAPKKKKVKKVVKAGDIAVGDIIEYNGQILTCAGLDQLGAILCDTDGKRVVI